MAELERALGRDVDLLVLNDAWKHNPALAYRVVTEGVVLFCRDQETLTDFKTRVFLAYFDTAFLREMVARAFQEQLMRLETHVRELQRFRERYASDDVRQDAHLDWALRYGLFEAIQSQLYQCMNNCAPTYSSQVDAAPGSTQIFTNRYGLTWIDSHPSHADPCESVASAQIRGPFTSHRARISQIAVTCSASAAAVQRGLWSSLALFALTADFAPEVVVRDAASRGDLFTRFAQDRLEAARV
ncbi:MAG: nucleotidyltransferase domain-containing protein, partial [Roseiflexus sp.]|nr:nucleotidyltransferase domain-containing protein [Roseiflexus sp.]